MSPTTVPGTTAYHHPILRHPALSVLVALQFLSFGFFWLVTLPAVRSGLEVSGLEVAEGDNTLALALMTSVSWTVTVFSVALGALIGRVIVRFESKNVGALADAMILRNRTPFKSLFTSTMGRRSRLALTGFGVVIGACIVVPCALLPAFSAYAAALWVVELPLAAHVYQLATVRYASLSANAGPTVIQKIGAGLFGFLALAASVLPVYLALELRGMLGP